VGDTLYAPPEVQAQADRLLLHSGMLSFPHPVTDAVQEYTVAPAF
jgi:tRNA pseudouridine32 synthase/23S rRNA pseudouridine746 synthase